VVLAVVALVGQVHLWPVRLVLLIRAVVVAQVAEHSPITLSQAQAVQASSS
jgi:hypothetical protein